MIEVFLLSSLGAQSAPRIGHFSFKMQKCPIFKVLNLKKENFNDWTARSLVPLFLSFFKSLNLNTSGTIVPQLNKCLKFEAILGDLTDQNSCI